jgi:hypothetical protein
MKFEDLLTSSEDTILGVAELFDAGYLFGVAFSGPANLVAEALEEVATETGTTIYPSSKLTLNDVEAFKATCLHAAKDENYGFTTAFIGTRHGALIAHGATMSEQIYRHNEGNQHD